MSATETQPIPDPWQAAREGAFCTRLAGVAFVDVDGPEASAFLQGQLSSDIAALEPGEAQWTSYNSPKGRMLANPLIYRPLAGSVYRLALPADLAAPFRRRLAMFVLRAKVLLSEQGTLAALGVGGPRSRAAVAEALGLTAAPMRVAAGPDPAVEVIGLADGRVVVVADAGHADDAMARLARCATMGPEDVWRWLGIRAGVAQVRTATQDRHVAQTANWEVVGGVSFTKGCYTGQEIVARMQHLGVVKERAHPFHAGAPAPLPATPIYSGLFGEQACGSVLDAVDLPEGGCDLLAVAQVSAVDAGDLRLGASDGPPLRRLPLPYALPASAPKRVKL